MCRTIFFWAPVGTSPPSAFQFLFHSNIPLPCPVSLFPESRCSLRSPLPAKWALVIAGVKDLSRPAEKLSVPQNLALAATGFIWVRYSLVITPINYSLAAVSSLFSAPIRRILIS